ncbi:DUF4132 domain-containing protein [Glycomyces paridis]|uniref:DUF4132 domain-containing protein n=1 Tax=Glycomyces paridis TaxID=2126555 RepID=A0A4V4HQ14_9ACTN|nr:DUF4132 domain-containing protein [Glycomyces paridis]THV32076.1 DUF4132 domain-containing protein [Glycomyces paridis]
MNRTDTSSQPERIELPDSWNAHLLARRDRGAEPVAVDADAPRRLAELYAKWAWQTDRITAAVEHPDHIAAIAAAAEGRPDPLGAALRARIFLEARPRIGAGHTALLRDAWAAEHGIAFAAQATLELMSFQMYWRAKSNYNEDTLSVREVALVSLAHYDGVAHFAEPMRALLAGLPDAEHAAARDALAARRSDELRRFLTAVLMPDQADWVMDACDVYAAETHADYGCGILWSIMSTKEHLERSRIRRLVRHWNSAQALAIAADALGLDVLPILRPILSGEQDAHAELRDHTYELLSRMPSDEALAHLLGDLGNPHAMVAARAAVKRFPDRALGVLSRIVAETTGPGQARLAGFAKATGLLEPGPGRDAADQARVAELLAATRRHPVAAAPAVFTTPPWESFARIKAGAAIALTAPDVDELRWEEGEREAWREAVDEDSWLRSPTVWQRSGYTEPGNYLFVEYLAFGPEEGARIDVGKWDGEVRNSSPGTILALLSRHGEAVASHVLALVKKKPSYRKTLLPFVNVDAARLAADWAARSRTDRAMGRRWLDRHAADAASLLVPDAVGKPGRPRQVAEEALRHLAETDREMVLKAAAAYGGPAAAAVEASLDADPLDPRVARIPKAPAWADPAMLPQLLSVGRETALPDEALRTLLSALILDDPERPYPGVEVLAAECDPASLAGLSWSLFELWTASGSPSKDGWAMDQLGRFADEDAVRRLTALIREWPGKSQARRSVRGLEILGRIGTETSLRAVHSIAGNGKFKSLKKTASAQIEVIAERLELSLDELADRLVPDFGLDADAATVLDYGPRSFTIAFDEGLKPFVLDDKGKRRASAPKPAAADDAELAQAAYERFAALRKDLKTTSAEQVKRLEAAMVAGRTWSYEDFRRFMVDHALMWQLASRLVWQAEEGGAHVSFRLAEDRTLADAEDEPIELADTARVRLAHPVTLGAEAVEAWATVFADYEILQPFDQLARKVYVLLDEERATGRLERFEHNKVGAGPIVGLLKRGWKFGHPKGHTSGRSVYRDIDGAVNLIIDTEPGVYPGYDPGGEQTVAIHLRGIDSVDLGALDPVAVSEALHTVARLTRTV